MSTFSPVTERTTSGPVTNTRPPVDMITRSVSAGPYAAPPAAGPSTTEICGTRPEARIIAWNTSPTACSASTPSASRAPPECHSPMHRHPLAHRGVDRVDDVPAAAGAHRAAHHRGVGAERDRPRAPSIVPAAASTPLSSRSCSSAQRARVEQLLEPQLAGRADRARRRGAGGARAVIWRLLRPCGTAAHSCGRRSRTSRSARPAPACGAPRAARRPARRRPGRRG